MTGFRRRAVIPPESSHPCSSAPGDGTVGVCRAVVESGVAQPEVGKGRRIRDPERMRGLIVGALLEAIGGGDRAPTARRLAELAGVSERSVFVHFTDLDDLRAAAAATQHERIVAELEKVDPDTPLDRRIAAVVAQRERIYPLQSVRRVAMAEAQTSPEIARRIAETDAVLAKQAREVFGRELARPGRRRDPQLARIVEAILGWGFRYHLCEVAGLSPASASRATVRALHATLADPALLQ